MLTYLSQAMVYHDTIADRLEQPFSRFFSLGCGLQVDLADLASQWFRRAHVRVAYCSEHKHKSSAAVVRGAKLDTLSLLDPGAWKSFQDPLGIWDWQLLICFDKLAVPLHPYDSDQSTGAVCQGVSRAK